MTEWSKVTNLLDPFTNKNITRLDDLPADPILVRVPDCSLSLLFHNYGSPLSRPDTYAAFLSAIQDVQLHLYDVYPMPHRNPGYLYSAGGVRLLVKPEQGMMWGMWGDALRGLRLFVEKWEFVVLEFAIWGEAYMGTGRLYGVG